MPEIATAISAPRKQGPRNQTGARASDIPVEIRRLGLIEYSEAFTHQHELAARRADGTLDHDVVLLLEHPAVFTAGRRTEDGDRPTDGSRVLDVDRGGKITWHGPGQLVAYPIIKLAEPLDVVDYVRRLEEALMSVCTEFGVQTIRVEGRSGVWLAAEPSTGRKERKIAAIGIRVSRGVALHGVSLNCDADLAAFSTIVPCGIPDAGVTSLTAECGRVVRVADAQELLAMAIARCLDGPRIPTTTRPEN